MYKKWLQNYLKFYLFVFIILGIGILIFEKAQYPRKIYFLIFLFGYFISIVGLIKIKKENSKKYLFTLIFSFFMLICMNIFSRFAINYFLILLHLLLMFTTGIIIRNKKMWVFEGIQWLYFNYIFLTVFLYQKDNIYLIQSFNFVLIASLTIVIAFITAKIIRDRDERENLYKELLKAHKELKNYADKVEELSVFKERQRIAREVHDALGHRLTALIMQLEIIKKLSKNETKKEAEIGLKTAKTALKDVRQLVSTLSKETVLEISDIDKFIEEFSKSQKVNIDKRYNLSTELSDELCIFSFYSIRELLTNALKHANAKNIKIEISNSRDDFKFQFINDGYIKKNIEVGFGLESIKKHCNRLNLNMKIEIDKEFKVYIGKGEI